MRFIVGFLAGAIAGAAAAVAYSVSTGHDLRQEFPDIRRDLSRGDLDALGARLAAHFNEISPQNESRVNQVRSGAESAADDDVASLDTLPDAAADAQATA